MDSSKAERVRLEALRRYDILDTPPDGTFDAITRLVRHVLGVPIAIVSLVDADRIWFKSHAGVDVPEIPRDPGLCASAILGSGPYVLTDASIDPRSLANPLVAGAFGLRFYAGVPLRTHDDHNLGVLCAIDHKPREVSPSDLALLSDLSSLVMDQMELRLSARRIHALNAELAQAHAAAERASKAKGEFLAHMSHELRTPLNAVLGLAHLLRNDPSATSRSARLDKMDIALNHVQGIIHDVLDLARIEASHTTLEPVDFALADLLGEVRSMIDDRAGANGVAVHIETADLPARLHGDVGRLRQALLNFAGNAVKFTTTGAITLRARPLPGAESLVRFEVQDTGPGIDAQALATLFQPFVQVPGQTASGTGLGLAITRALAQLMGGDAGARSTPGQGSLFWFSARLEPAKSRPARGSASTPGLSAEARLRARSAGHRVLVVDDDEVNREVVSELLTLCGLLADTAADGPEALGKAQRQPYCLILSDVYLPGFDGLALTRQLRKLLPDGQPPILALTGSTEAEQRRACLDAGMNAVLTKPVDPETLFDALLTWLPARPAPAAGV